MSRFFILRMSKKIEQAEKTKASILDAAIEVFYQKGYMKATLEDIAKEANVTRGAIYWSFKNKQDIFKTLHENLYQNVMQIISESLKGDKSLANLQETCVNCLTDLANNDKRKKLLTVFLIKCDYSDMEDILEIQTKQKLQKIEYFANFFESNKELLKQDASPYSLAVSLSCYTTGIVNEYLRNELFDLAAQAEILIKQFFQSIIKHN